MGRHKTPPACGHSLYRPAVGVPTADLDAGPVHLAAADHEDNVRAAGDGVLETLLQQHRLSQYWVRPVLLFNLIIACHYITYLKSHMFLAGVGRD